MRCGFWTLGFSYQISGHSQGFFRNTLEMPHSVSPRLTVYWAGAGADFDPDCSSACRAASVAVSSDAVVAAGAVSATGGADSSTGGECRNRVEQPLTEITAAISVADRPVLNARLKV